MESTSSSSAEADSKIVDNLRFTIERKQGALEEAVAKIKEKETIIEQQTERIQSLDEEVANLKMAICKLSSDNEDVIMKCNSLNSEIASYKGEMQRTDAHNTELAKLNQQLNNEIEMYKLKISDLQTHMKSISAELKSRDGKINTLLSENEQKIYMKNHEIDRLQKLNAEKELELQERAKNISEKNDEISRHCSELNKLAALYKTCEKKVIELKSINENLNEMERIFISEHSKLKEHFSDKQREIINLNDLLEKVRNESDHRSSDIISLRETITKLENSYVELEKINQMLSEEKSTLQMKLIERPTCEILQELQKKYDTCLIESEEKTKQLKEFNDKWEKLQSELDEKSVENEENVKKIQHIEMELGYALQKIDDLRNELIQNNQVHESLIVEFETYKNTKEMEIHEMASKVKSDEEERLLDKWRYSETLLKAYEEREAAYKSRMEELEKTKIEERKAKREYHDKALKLQTELYEEKIFIKQLEEQITELKIELNAANDGKISYEEQIINLKDVIDRLKNNSSKNAAWNEFYHKFRELYNEYDHDLDLAHSKEQILQRNILKKEEETAQLKSHIFLNEEKCKHLTSENLTLQQELSRLKEKNVKILDKYEKQFEDEIKTKRFNQETIKLCIEYLDQHKSHIEYLKKRNRRRHDILNKVFQDMSTIKTKRDVENTVKKYLSYLEQEKHLLEKDEEKDDQQMQEIDASFNERLRSRGTPDLKNALSQFYQKARMSQ